ncbi:MAG: DUF3800 domain-containing protein, partial [Candidatus Cybelea sp.]
MSTTYLYVDEAGRSRLRGTLSREQPYFIVGVLMTNDPNALRGAIARARAAFHFPHELHWTKQGNLRNQVYERVVAEVRKVNQWAYKATCIPVENFDLSYYGNREDRAYNRMVRMGIEMALFRYPRIPIREDFDITIDMKQRLAADNCIEYIRQQCEGPEIIGRNGEEFLKFRSVEVREVDSKTSDLVQLCDLFSGAKNSLLAKNC